MKPQQRLHQMDTPIIGLTGGIASGKSTVASLLSEMGVVVISADKLVKQLYEQKQTLDFIQKNFPQCIKNGNIHFPSLRKKAFQDKSARTSLEDFIHPRLPELFKKTVDGFRPLPDSIVYDIPLLFEKNLESQFDLVVCVYCHPEKQKKRLLARDNIDETLALAMIKEQMDIDIKRKKADVVIDNSGTMKQLSSCVHSFVKQYL